MIEILGGTFEGTLTKNKTTHLIASVQSGSKVTHARPWGIPIINHFWIEDSFKRWQAADVNDQRYLNFEPSLIESDLPHFSAGRAVDMNDVQEWAKQPEVRNERDESLKNLEDAIVDEMDEAQEDELLLSSPEDGPEVEMVVEEVRQSPQAVRLERPILYESDMASSPMPSLKDMIAATQFAPARLPSTSEESEASAPAHVATAKAKKAAPASKKAPVANGKANGGLKPKSLEPPSSMSDYFEAKQEIVETEKKRKRASLAGLGHLDSGFDTSIGYSGRKAAQAATQKLRDTIMPDVILYEKEKRGGGAKHLEEMFGGKAINSSPKKNGSTQGGRRANGRAGTRSTTESDSEEGMPPAPGGRGAKRSRQDSPPTPHVGMASKAIKGRTGSKGQPKAPSPTYEYMSEQKPK